MLLMSLKSCLPSSSVFRSGLKHLLFNYDNFVIMEESAAGFELMFQHLVSFLPIRCLWKADMFGGFWGLSCGAIHCYATSSSHVLVL